MAQQAIIHKALLEALVGAREGFSIDTLPSPLRDCARDWARMYADSDRSIAYLVGSFLGALARDGKIRRMPARIITAVYIIGPFRGDEAGNRARAEEVAARLWERGYTVLCPHLNSPRRELLGTIPEERFLAGYCDLLRRCDAAVLLPGWEESEGSRAEAAQARLLGMPVSTWSPAWGGF